MKRREIIVRNLTTPHFGCVIFPTLSHSHKPSESTESTRSISPRNCFFLAVVFLVSCYTEYMWILWQIHWIIPPAFQIIWVLVSNDGSWTFFLKGLLMHSWVHTISAFNCPQRAARLSLRRLQSVGAALGALSSHIPYPDWAPVNFKMWNFHKWRCLWASLLGESLWSPWEVLAIPALEYPDKDSSLPFLEFRQLDFRGSKPEGAPEGWAWAALAPCPALCMHSPSGVLPCAATATELKCNFRAWLLSHWCLV